MNRHYVGIGSVDEVEARPATTFAEGPHSRPSSTGIRDPLQRGRGEPKVDSLPHELGVLTERKALTGRLRNKA